MLVGREGWEGGRDEMVRVGGWRGKGEDGREEGRDERAREEGEVRRREVTR
jgi:hypothetical protein